MSRIIAILIANFFVVDYGVVPDGNDNSVYVIQIEPEVAKQLVAGYTIESVIPPELRGIRKFRIQIGDEKLIKPALLPALEGQEAVSGSTAAPATSNADRIPNDVPEGEATGIDSDAFPLLTESEKSSPTVDTRLIPEPVDASDLPGNPEGFVIDDIDVREVLEPDTTTLPQLIKTPIVFPGSDLELEPSEIVKQSDTESVVVPVFDKPDFAGVVETSENVEQIAIPALDLLDIQEAGDRIVLGDLPDLSNPSGEREGSTGAVDNEPKELESDAANFVKLATATTIGENVPSLKSGVKVTNALSPEPRSWPLFSITLLGLLVSVGGNVYLGITILGFYRKRHGSLSDLASPSDAVSE